MFTLIRTKKLRELEDWLDSVINKNDRAQRGISQLIDVNDKLAAENLSLLAKLRAYEKTYKIRTGPWKDSIGRWRDEKTGHCIKAPDPIRETSEQLRDRMIQQQRLGMANSTRAGGQVGGSSLADDIAKGKGRWL